MLMEFDKEVIVMASKWASFDSGIRKLIAYGVLDSVLMKGTVVIVSRA